jgi:hypothetical protein
VVRKITAAGQVTDFAADANSAGFTFLAVTDDARRPLALPVPEPATFAAIALLAVARAVRPFRPKPETGRKRDGRKTPGTACSFIEAIHRRKCERSDPAVS